MAQTSSPSLISRLIAEAFGTFLLVLGVIGAALFVSPQTGPLGVAIAVGLAVIAGAYSVGHISGGHFNPAVSLGAAAAGRLPWKDVAPYVGAQIVGGLVASTILFLVNSARAGKPALTFGDVSNGYDAHSPSGFSLLAVVIVELVATLVFVWIILSVTTAGLPITSFAPLVIGLSLTLFHLIAIPVSNASLNPARSIATAVFGGPDALLQLWAFIVAPAVGGLLAGITWKPLFNRN